MQDEVNERVIAISIKATQLSAVTLQRAIKLILEQMREHQKQDTIIHGKQTLPQLMKQNTTVSNIEITDDNIKAFEHTAKKYGIDYALKKDRSVKPNRFLVFFKGRDVDVITAAFQEFSEKTLKTQDKSSIMQEITKIKEKQVEMQSTEPSRTIPERELTR